MPNEAIYVPCHCKGGGFRRLGSINQRERERDIERERESERADSTTFDEIFDLVIVFVEFGDSSI